MNKGDTVTLKGSLMFRKQPLGSRDEWFMSIELGVRGTFVAYRNSRSGRMAEIEYAPGVCAIVPADAVEVVTDNNVGESEQASQPQDLQKEVDRIRGELTEAWTAPAGEYDQTQYIAFLLRKIRAALNLPKSA